MKRTITMLTGLAIIIMTAFMLSRRFRCLSKQLSPLVLRAAKKHSLCKWFVGLADARASSTFENATNCRSQHKEQSH